MNSFYTHLRELTGLTEDGRSLIDRALAANEPIIKLNEFKSDTDRKEQKGYAEFSYGVTDALRNVLSHHLADDHVTKPRFGDRRTALKFLCLISLLFEKLDARVAPH